MPEGRNPSEISFRRLCSDDLRVIEAWFRDPLLARRIQPPDATWIDYILSDNGMSRSWVGLMEEEGPVAEIQVDQQKTDGPGYINFYIRP